MYKSVKKCVTQSALLFFDGYWLSPRLLGSLGDRARWGPAEVRAVAEGRKIYGNIQRFVCFLLGTNRESFIEKLSNSWKVSCTLHAVSKSVWDAR